MEPASVTVCGRTNWSEQEYIIVHEMVHLLERHRDDRFTTYMNTFMPQWSMYREELNRAPLAHEVWDY